MGPRTLDRCGVCSIAGERAADELFGCAVQSDIDMDSTSGMIVMDGIVRDKAKCDACVVDQPHTERRG